MKTYQVIVVGAGIAGLTAAYKLQKKGIDVLVLEASQRVGGRMATESKDGYIIDSGAQFLSSAYPIISKLIQELGLSKSFVDVSQWVGIIREGKIRKFRYDRPLSLYFGGLFNFKDWLSFSLRSIKLIMETKTLPLNNYAAWHEYDNETAKKWSDDYYGKQITEYFTEPLLEALYFQDPEHTSKALPIALNAFSGHKAKVKTLVGGISKLTEAMKQDLNIHLNKNVNKITIDNNNNVFLETDDNSFSANRIILATPASVSKILLKNPDKIQKKLLNTKYSSTINVSIALKRKLQKNYGLDDIYGLWIPKTERKVISAISIESKKSKERVSKGELINVMLSGKAANEMFNFKDEEILRILLNELETYMPRIWRNISFIRVNRWKDAEPMSHIGRSRDILAYRKKVHTSSRVILAGDYLAMPFTEGAAESGVWAASKIL